MSVPRHRAAAAVTFLCLWACQAGAYPLHKGEYAFWSQMPDAARVTNDVAGDGDFETAARRHAAFVLLIALVNVSADGKGQLPWPQREQALNRAYYHALPHLDAIGAASGRTADLWARSGALQADPSFTRPLLKRYFSRDALREIEPYVSSFERLARVRAEQALVQSSPTRASAAIGEPLATVLRTSLYAVAGLSGALFLVGLFGELKVVRIVWAPKSMLLAGFRKYGIHTVTGVVRSPTKALETVTRVSGNEYNVSSSSTTHVHDQFFIAHSGGEMPVQLIDFNLPLRDGHLFSAVWAIRRGRERGPFILLHNHTTNQRIVVDRVLRSMLRPRLWPLPVLLLTIWAAGLQALFALTNFSQSSVGLAIPMAVGVTICGTIGWLLASVIIARWRVRRFRRGELERLSQALDARKNIATAAMTGWTSPA